MYVLCDSPVQTALTLVWCLYCLTRNPEVQEKLRSEVMGVVGEEKMVSPAHINRMPYLRHCIKETLRYSSWGWINKPNPVLLELRFVSDI